MKKDWYALPSQSVKRTKELPKFMKVLFLVTEDNYFWTHRLGLARKVRDAGAEVVVMTRIGKLAEQLRSEGFTLVHWEASRGSLNPASELSAFLQVCSALRSLRPDLVHHIALKPIVYGGLAAQLCGKLPAVNAVAGLGEVFHGQSAKMSAVRKLLVPLLRMAMRPARSRTITQNQQNSDHLIALGIIQASQVRMIRGVGVDTVKFSPRPEPIGTPVVMLASRMLWSKGVGEFVAAARILRERGVQAKFQLVGGIDDHNPAGISVGQLQAWREQGLVEWLGHRDDMAEALNSANLICLPSYGEGLPKVLIEAAACGRAIITSDVPGCRDVVRQGENGLLVPVRDVQALAEAIQPLLANQELRKDMGRNGRELVMRQFTEERIIAETFAVYRELLGDAWPQQQEPPIKSVS